MVSRCYQAARVGSAVLGDRIESPRSLKTRSCWHWWSARSAFNGHREPQTYVRLFCVPLRSATTMRWAGTMRRLWYHAIENLPHVLILVPSAHSSLSRSHSPTPVNNNNIFNNPNPSAAFQPSTCPQAAWPPAACRSQCRRPLPRNYERDGSSTG